MEELALPADKAQDELPALAAPRPPPASPSWGPRTRRTFTAATRSKLSRARSSTVVVQRCPDILLNSSVEETPDCQHRGTHSSWVPARSRLSPSGVVAHTLPVACLSAPKPNPVDSYEE
ncbi:uncharacterized protein LOC141972514 isoform X8 [Athene noctua]|uniref:uncharacterized protein LOC141972514 isoform X8 n=1 Tax=Athene noctua TaxID=126797 RepID=UPI003EB824E7